jgi:hypothetical protein
VTPLRPLSRAVSAARPLQDRLDRDEATLVRACALDDRGRFLQVEVWHFGRRDGRDPIARAHRDAVFGGYLLALEPSPIRLGDESYEDGDERNAHIRVRLGATVIAVEHSPRERRTRHRTPDRAGGGGPMRLLRDWRLPDEYLTDREGREDYEWRVRRWQRALYLPMILLVLAPAAIGWMAGSMIARSVVWLEIDRADRQAPQPPSPAIHAPSASPATN